jgi:putative FmdB family regulatory protein
MPIYEYQCANCGVFETTQRITEKPLKRCPTCKGAVHRIISHTSFVLKGNGWYATDYARTNPAKSDSASDSPSNDSGSGSNGSADNSSSSSEKATEKAAKPAAEKSSASKAAAD